MTTKVRMTREAPGHYRYTSPDGTLFEATHMLTNWGDMQWLVDVIAPGKMVETFCVDTLAQVRHNIACWNI
jgi:hypothetical protein